MVVAGLWRMARALRGGVVRWSCFLAMQCRRHGGCQVGQQTRHAGGWCIYVEFMLAHVRGDSTVAARWCRWCTHVCTWDSCWGAPPRQYRRRSPVSMVYVCTWTSFWGALSRVVNMKQYGRGAGERLNPCGRGAMLPVLAEMARPASG